MKRITAKLFSMPRLAAAAVILVLVGLALTPASSSATPINYGDFAGTTVMYLDVTEDTNTGDTLPLYGAPVVSGDSLDFDPIGFSANSSGGGPPDITDGQLDFGIMALPGKAINSILLSEAGDTTLSRAIGSSDDAFTQVTSNVFIDILEINGVGINPINVAGVMTFSPSNGDYQLSVDGSGFIYNTGWTGSYFLNLATVPGVNGLVTKVSVNMDNTLTASTAANSSAFIAKKDADGLTITTNIPEPTSALLALTGLLALAGSRRRG